MRKNSANSQHYARIQTEMRTCGHVFLLCSLSPSLTVAVDLTFVPEGKRERRSMESSLDRHFFIRPIVNDVLMETIPDFSLDRNRTDVSCCCCCSCYCFSRRKEREIFTIVILLQIFLSVTQTIKYFTQEYYTSSCFWFIFRARKKDR